MCQVIPGLNLPQQSISETELKKRYPYLKDVEMEELERVKPTTLIGLEHAHLGAPALIRVGKFNEPIASKTKLGWTINGPDLIQLEVRCTHFLPVIAMMSCKSL